MSVVKSLPESVRSSVRSGIVLFDIARVVEELVFNSLDARASKVSIFVGIGTGNVKVSDDGTGITRDGLELVGERYATSKFDHLADTNINAGSFGFRGEALASISDVSLLEIVTKASGRPNGYRKVMKGSTCLYLGICDGIRDPGTTVSVRDLFYNQPVRRKFIQSSPRKVLQSIKKCVLRIALVHSKVSFKLVDIESDDILLCTQASSLTSLLTTWFGIDISSSLHKLDIGDSKLKLFGYISGPCENLPIKAFQYVYINSRFVCKGPIHNLVNQLATTFELNDKGKAVMSTQNRKRSRPQTNSAFIINISCPRSFYDLNFEPSKTYVEFKDWVPVLAFLNEAIQQLWNEIMPYDVLEDTVGFAANILDQDEMLCGYENEISAKDLGVRDSSVIMKNKCSMGSFQASPDSLCSDLKIPSEKISYWPPEKHDITPIQRSKIKCSMRSLQASPDPICSDLIISPVKSSFWPLEKHDITPIQLSKKKCSMRSLHALPDPIFSELKFPVEEGSYWSLEKHGMTPISCEYSNYLNGQDTDLCYNSKTNQLEDSHFSNYMSGISRTCENQAYISDYKLVPVESYFSVNEASLRGWFRDTEDGSNFSLRQRKDFFEGSPSNRSGSVSFALNRDCQQSNNVEMFRTANEPFLKSCSTRRTIPRVSSLLTDSDCGFQSDEFKVHEILAGSSDKIDISETARNMSQDQASSLEFFPRANRLYRSAAELESLPGDFGESVPFYEERFDRIEDFSFGLVPVQRYRGNSHLELDSELGSVASYFYSQSQFWDDERYSDMNIDEGRRKYNRVLMDDKNCRGYGYATLGTRFSKQNCTTSCSNGELEDYGSGRPQPWRGLNRKFSLNQADVFCDDTGWLSFNSPGKILKSSGLDKIQRCKNDRKREYVSHFSKRRTRSRSAPPFYKSKRKFSSLYCHLIAKPNNISAHREIREHPKSSAVRDSSLDERQELKKGQVVKKAESNTKKDDLPLKETISKEFQESQSCGTKWRDDCSKTSINNKSRNHDDQDNILDISSGILHLASDSLIPESISKTCLDNAIVLQQIDKKYIPIVSGRTLAAVDQHAADERIRLEELRHKVLTGEAKTITFLDAEQELTLPEIGHQLLHNYSEEIKKWGWICNFPSRDSRSFKRSLNILHQQPAAITLKAVPCILGVNLSDVDLMEFLQQLADTDGSSMIPPSVLRILNSKACRGAIMFGDSLLPSECSLLISELKRTSLCFQCAHGRPTIAPLVNLEALHKQITKINPPKDGSNGLWHGLHRHELSLERAEQRLCA